MKLISIGTKGNILACSLRDDNILIKERTWKSDGGNIYNKYLEAILKSVGYVRSYLEEHRDDEVIVFEVSNSIVANWVRTDTCGKPYKELFTKVMLSLDAIPMRYIFSKVDKPRCNYEAGSDMGLASLDSLIEGEE